MRPPEPEKFTARTCFFSLIKRGVSRRSKARIAQSEHGPFPYSLDRGAERLVTQIFEKEKKTAAFYGSLFSSGASSPLGSGFLFPQLLLAQQQDQGQNTRQHRGAGKVKPQARQAERPEYADQNYREHQRRGYGDHRGRHRLFNGGQEALGGKAEPPGDVGQAEQQQGADGHLQIGGVGIAGDEQAGNLPGEQGQHSRGGQGQNDGGCVAPQLNGFDTLDVSPYSRGWTKPSMVIKMP